MGGLVATPENLEVIERCVNDAIAKVVDTSTEEDLPGIEVGFIDSRGRFVGAGEDNTVSRGGISISKTATRTCVELDAANDNEVASTKRLTDGDDDFSFDMDTTLAPPYNFKALQELLITDVIHDSAVETKAADYAYNGWELALRQDAKDLLESGGLSESVLKDDKETVQRFLESMGGDVPVADVMNAMALDYEALGMSALEVRRVSSGVIGAVSHMPFTYVRVIDKNKAQQQEIRATYLQKRFSKKVYFTKFAEAVSYKKPGFNPYTSPINDFPRSESERQSAVNFNADFMLSASNGKRVGEKSNNIANELLVLPRLPFTKSDTYGTPAGIQALSSMIAQKKIDEYNIQFFQAKGVTQYAVIIEGLTRRAVAQAAPGSDAPRIDMGAKVRAAISEYFQNQLTSADRAVLVVSLFGDAKIKFERLSSESVEASFAEYETRNTERIRMSHRIPPAALGLAETANLGGGRDTAQLIRYRDHIVSPGQRRLAIVVNDLLRVGLLIPWFEFRFNALDVENAKDMREYWLKAFVDGGITLNQYLTKVGETTLPEDIGGDVHYIRTGGNVTTVNEDLGNASAALRMARGKADAVGKYLLDLAQSDADR